MTLTNKGEFNHAIGCIGVPHTGKTVKAVEICTDFSRNPGAYVIAMDPNEDLPEKLPNGRKTGVIRHSNLDGVKSAIAGSNPEGIHAIGTTSCNAMVDLAKLISKYSLQSHGGKQGVPSIVFIDEISVCDEAGEHRIDKNLKDLLCRRRHHHVGLVYTTQSPRLCHYQIFALSTELYLFRVTEEDDLKRMRKGMVPQAILDRLPSLPDYHYIRYKK